MSLAEDIANITKNVNDFKKENLDTLQKKYGEKMSKVKKTEEEIADVPKKYAGKSRTFIEKKQKQLKSKVDKMTENVNNWYKNQKDKITEKVESMLKSKKKEAEEKDLAEKQQAADSAELASKMSS